MATVKSVLKKIPLTRHARAQVRRWLDKREGKRLFENYDQYLQALDRKGAGTVLLRTRDGLDITIRQNIWDARIIREIFFGRPYDRHLTLPPRPVVVDIGGYIGDFSIYAAKYLNAARVVVYEPTAENFEILRRNVEVNGLADRITSVNKAVGVAGEIVLNVQVEEDQEIHVSAYWYMEAEQRKVPSVTLSDLIEEHRLDMIDLLKVDCEGGEFDIFPAMPAHLFDRIRNIVFEYHPIEGYREKLGSVLDRLQTAGYRLHRDGYIVTATRS